MAKRSNFRLEQLLDLKHKHEEAMALKLGLAQVAERTERDLHAALEALRQAGRDDLLGVHRGRRVGELAPLRQLLDRLEERLDQQARRVEAAERTVADAQAQLVAAHQARRVLDKLKERHGERVREESKHEDQQTMDEIAVARFLRSKGPDR